MPAPEREFGHEWNLGRARTLGLAEPGCRRTPEAVESRFFED